MEHEDIILAARKKASAAFERLNAILYGSPGDTFDHLLEFIVNGFEIGGEGLKNWPYSKEKTALFLDTFREIVLAQSEILSHTRWYDILGCIYEDAVASKGRRSGSGQFFTPMTVCEMMAGIVTPKEKDETVLDPCCGSGRLLLAACAGRPGTRAEGGDIDRTCVLMTVVNFLMHGVRGTVRHKDALTNQEFDAWVVNPGILPEVPHCVKLKKSA